MALLFTRFLCITCATNRQYLLKHWLVNNRNQVDFNFPAGFGPKFVEKAILVDLTEQWWYLGIGIWALV